MDHRPALHVYGFALGFVATAAFGFWWALAVNTLVFLLAAAANLLFGGR